MASFGPEKAPSKEKNLGLNKKVKKKENQSNELYHSMLKQLYARAPLANKLLPNGQRPPPSLATMHQITSLLDNPQKKYECIHVGGTNGKGSVATKIANVLHKYNDLKVGLFTSPHISCIRERIQVNNEMIPENDFINGLNDIFECETNFNKNNDSLSPIQANFFEIMTILAFYHFHRAKCDVAVIEVGIGGTWDHTNIIESPLLSVMTSVSLDHTKILGKTVEAIAADKAGIIKHKRPIVIGPSVPLNIVANVAKTKEASLYRVFDYVKNNENEYYTFFDPKCDINVNKPLNDKNNTFNSYNDENDSIACCALEIIHSELNAKINSKNKENGKEKNEIIIGNNRNDYFEFLNIRPKCRLETHKLYLSLSSKKNNNLVIAPVNVILDVAHNPGGMRSLFESLNNIYPRKEYCYRVVIGMCQDKDIGKCMIEVIKHASYIHLVCAKNFYRSSNIDHLQKKIVQCMNDLGIVKKDVSKYIICHSKGNVSNEMRYALKQCAIHNANSVNDINDENANIKVSLLSNYKHNDKNENSENANSEDANNDKMKQYIFNSIDDNDNDNENENENESESSERKSDFSDSDYENNNDENNSEMNKDIIVNKDENEESLKNKKEILIVMGSFYIMADARNMVGMKEACDDVYLDQKTMDNFNNAPLK